MIKRTMLIGWIALLVLAPFCAATCSAQSAPSRRVVSFNLCADQLLLALADPVQIAGLSPYAVNSALSVMTNAGARFRRLDWDAESIVNLSPDLVLSGPSNRPTQAMLSAMGIRVVDIDLIKSPSAARQQAREVGTLLGHPERGEALANQIEQAEARLAAAALTPPRTALVIQREGYREGTASLVSAMLSIAGLRPPANSPTGSGGFMSTEQGGFVSLEQLLIDGPDVLVLQDPPREAGDQGALFITHPALLARYGAKRRIDLPERYTLCGGPPLLQGLDYLAKAITALR